MKKKFCDLPGEVVQLEQNGGKNRTGIYSEQLECIVRILIFLVRMVYLSTLSLYKI
jgi:hypothetical protein